MNFFNEVGKVALGSRLRMPTEKITEDAARVYRLYNVDLQPKWFPVFYALSQGEQKAITTIANEIGHSHPSVSKIISEMSAKGIVTEKKDSSDGRKNVVSLSRKGKALTAEMRYQYADVEKAIGEISAQSDHDLWKAIEEWEFLLSQKTLLRRVAEQKKLRESADIQIIDYLPEHQHAFRALNEEWISAYFKMEAADYKALDDPKGY
ncbi:MAG: helix-turn-helix domain-containing protein, partial [Ferruginibacter sp.]